MRLALRFGLVGVFVLALAGTAVAATPQRPPGVQVKPLRAYPNQAPGQTTNGSFTVTNNTDQPQEVSFAAERFKTIDEDYNYAFDKDVITDWVDFKEPNMELKPKQSKVQNYTIAVPADATPGGRYIALLTSVTPKSDQQSVTQINRVASLVYLEVTGKITRTVQLLSTDVPSLVEKPQTEAIIRLANTGNSHYRARVGLSVGRWPSTNNITKSQPETVLLPGTVRKVSETINLPKIPGVYKITVDFSPPQGGKTSLTRTVVYTPVWFIGLFVAVLGGLVISLFRWRSRSSRKKKQQ